MIIDFNDIKGEVIKNFKGGEKEITMHAYVDSENRIMKCTLEPGASIGMHTHENNREILFIVSGHGHMLEDGTKKPIAAGQCAYCPKGGSHSLVNDGNEPLVFCAVVAQ